MLAIFVGLVYVIILGAAVWGAWWMYDETRDWIRRVRRTRRPKVTGPALKRATSGDYNADLEHLPADPDTDERFQALVRDLPDPEDEAS